MGLTQSVPPYAEPIHIAEAKAQCRVDWDDENTHLLACITAARRYGEKFTGRQLVTATWQWRMDGFCPDENGCLRPPHAPLLAVPSITYTDAAGAIQSWADYLVDLHREPGRIAPAYGANYPAARRQLNSVLVTYTAGHVTPFTVDAVGDTVVWQGRTPANGALVRLSNSGGALPGGLSPATDYYVVGAAGNACGLSLTANGQAVDIVNEGNGTHFIGELPGTLRKAMLLLIAHWFAHREAVITGTIQAEVSWAVNALLMMEWTGML